MYNYGKKLCDKHLGINEDVASVLIFGMICFLMFIPFAQAHSLSKQEIPSMNDAWYNSLTEIKDRSEPDAIINSWWDFGHWFKAIGDRAVTFDGGSQNNAMAHWIGKVLLTQDERVAVGILRMLDCSSDEAGKYIQYEVYDGDIDDMINLVNVLFVMNKTTAKQYLKQKGLEQHTNKIMELMFCEPPENYFITSGDMVMKAGVWAHFGSWSFEKAQMWQNVKGMEFEEGVEYIMKNFSKTEKHAEELYYKIQGLRDGREANTWIAPWPSYMSGDARCSRQRELIVCDNGLTINSTGDAAYVNTAQGLKTIEKMGFINNKSEFGVRNFPNGELDVAAVITPDGKSVLMQPALVGSMFTRLFYMNSIGLKHFEKFSDKRSINGDRIIVWKINWDGIQDE